MDNNECLSQLYDARFHQTICYNGIVWRHEPNGNWFIAGYYGIDWSVIEPFEIKNKKLIRKEPIKYGSGVVSSPIKTNPDAQAIKDYYDKRHPTIWRG